MTHCRLVLLDGVGFYNRVSGTVGNQHRLADLRQQVVVIEGSREHPLANIRGDREVVSQHEIQLGRRGFSGEAQLEQSLQTTGDGFCVSGEELRNDVEKFRSEDRHRLRTAQLGDPPDELQSADLLLTVVPNVVEEDKRTVRPSGEHRMIQVKTLN